MYPSAIFMSYLMQRHTRMAVPLTQQHLQAMPKVSALVAGAENGGLIALHAGGAGVPSQDPLPSSTSRCGPSSSSASDSTTSHANYSSASDAATPSLEHAAASIGAAAAAAAAGVGMETSSALPPPAAVSAAGMAITGVAHGRVASLPSSDFNSSSPLSSSPSIATDVVLSVEKDTFKVVDALYGNTHKMSETMFSDNGKLLVRIERLAGSSDTEGDAVRYIVSVEDVVRYLPLHLLAVMVRTSVCVQSMSIRLVQIAY